jgi:hypothetical protein
MATDYQSIQLAGRSPGGDRMKARSFWAISRIRVIRQSVVNGLEGCSAGETMEALR